MFCGECYTHYTVCLSPLRTTVCGNLENVAAGTGREKSLQKESLIASRFSKGPSNRLGQKRDVDSTYQMNESRKTHNNGRGKKEMNNQDVFVFEREFRHTISRLFSSIQPDPLDFFFSLSVAILWEKEEREKKGGRRELLPPRSFPTFFQASVLSIRPRRNRKKEGKLSDPDVGHYRWRALLKKKGGSIFVVTFFTSFLGGGTRSKTN